MASIVRRIQRRVRRAFATGQNLNRVDSAKRFRKSTRVPPSGAPWTRKHAADIIRDFRGDGLNFVIRRHKAKKRK